MVASSDARRMDPATRSVCKFRMCEQILHFGVFGERKRVETESVVAINVASGDTAVAATAMVVYARASRAENAKMWGE